MGRLLYLLLVLGVVKVLLLKRSFWTFLNEQTIRLASYLLRNLSVTLQKSSLLCNCNVHYKENILYRMRNSEMGSTQYSVMNALYYLIIKDLSVTLLSWTRLNTWHLWGVSIWSLIILQLQYLKEQLDLLVTKLSIK